MLPDKRLDRIAEKLTPKQLAILYIRELHSHPDVFEYVRSLRGVRLEALPAQKLLDQLVESTQGPLKGKPQTVINSAVKKAEKDLLFLIRLHGQANTYFLSEQRFWAALLVLMDFGLRLVDTEKFYERLRAKKERKKTAKNLKSNWEQGFCREMIVLLFRQLHGFRTAVSLLGRNYFADEALLFPDAAMSLAELLRNVDFLVSGFNAELEDGSNQKIETETFKIDIDKEAVERTSYIIDMAKAQTFEAMGDNQGGLELVERHIDYDPKEGEFSWGSDVK